MSTALRLVGWAATPTRFVLSTGKGGVGINATLPGSGTNDPVLASRARLEHRQVRRVAELTTSVWRWPWSPRL